MDNQGPYREVWTLYLMHLSFALVSRMWDFGIILFIAELTQNSLFIVAMAGFLSSFSIFAFMPLIGSCLDSLDRMVATKAALAVKLGTVSIAYIFCAMFSHWSYSGPVSHPVIYLLPVLCAVASLAFCTITQAIEKDWLVVLSNGDSNWLASTNSIMSQIDLGCNSVGPTITGALFAVLSPTFMAFLLLGLNALVTMSLLFYMQQLYNSWPSLAVKASRVIAVTANSGSESGNPLQKINEKSTKSSSYMPVETLEDQESKIEGVDCAENTSSIKTSLGPIRPFPNWSFWVVVDALRDFSESGCAGVMVAYACLYFTVLSFGSLMTVYLRWCGLSDTWIGLSRGLASLMGFAGAAIFPAMRNHFGLWTSALIAIWYQCCLVAVAAGSFYWLDRYQSMVVVVVATLFSRTGLWLFDLCARQIAQEKIDESVRGVVNGQWRAIIAFFDMSTYGVAIAIPDPRDFSALTTISATMVLTAAITYTFTRGSYAGTNMPSTSNVFNAQSGAAQNYRPTTNRSDLDDANRDDDDDDDFEVIELSSISQSASVQ